MEKIRTPRTTTTPVDSWVAHPQLVTEEDDERRDEDVGRNETTNTLSMKIPSRTAGCLVTGNEDGVKHCAMNTLYSLQHLGYVIPPQADAGWIGEAGPGPSYLDEGSGGPENDFTNRNTTFATWNLLHMARMLKDAGGIPAHGNQRSEWDAGARFDFPNPEHR